MQVEDIASQTMSFLRHCIQHDWKHNFWGSCSCFPR